jgi:hypothetical protein
MDGPFLGPFHLGNVLLLHGTTLFGLGTAAATLYYCTIFCTVGAWPYWSIRLEKITPSSTVVSNHARPLLSLRQRAVVCDVAQRLGVTSTLLLTN